MDTDIPLFFSEIQYLLLETIPLENIMRVEVSDLPSRQVNDYLPDQTKILLVTRPAQVGEKVAFVQVVAGLKDNGRKEHQEKGSRRKFLHVLDLVVGKKSHEKSNGGPKKDYGQTLGNVMTLVVAQSSGH